MPSWLLSRIDTTAVAKESSLIWEGEKRSFTARGIGGRIVAIYEDNSEQWITRWDETEWSSIGIQPSSRGSAPSSWCRRRFLRWTRERRKANVGRRRVVELPWNIECYFIIRFTGLHIGLDTAFLQFRLRLAETITLTALKLAIIKKFLIKEKRCDS